MDRKNRTRLFLIRHGDTIDEETKKVFKGSKDIPLSYKGKARLRKASQFLTRFNFDHIYTSALSRCIESGKIIAEPHNLETEVVAAFNEIHFGIWEGRSFEEIDEENPTEFRRWVKNPDIHTPPQGEPLIEAQKRCVSAFNETVNRHRGQNIAIVAHAGIIRLILASILDMKLSTIFNVGQDYGCINIVDIYKDDIFVIKLLNFTMY